MIEGICKSGLRYAVKRGSKAVGYCALSVRCGTRDEARYIDGVRDSRGYPSGTAHFVEHTIFKGTAKKNASTINGYLDRLGGELNAYTTKEEIVLHATVLREDLSKAAGLLLELVTSPTFPAGEVETERGVIIDEINSYKDLPSEEVYDMFEELLFAGHPLSGPILGKVGTVKKIKPEVLARFVAEKFRPENMAFTVVADEAEEKLERLVLRLCEKFFPEPEPAAAAEAGAASASAAFVPRPPFHTIINRRNHQVNCVVGATAPSLYDMQDRIAAVLLANIIGGPASNSILNSILREKRGWVYGVECSYTQYSDTGIMAIIFGCDKENTDKCLKAIDKELSKLRGECLSEARLKAAKKQLLGQLAISGDNGENQCLSMGKSLLAYGHVFTDAQSRAQIEAVTSDDLRRLAATIFDSARLSTLIIS